MSEQESAPIRVWDLPTRLFHWLLAVLIALQYTSGEFGWPSMPWHYRFGYATLALIAFRLLWGLAGSQTSRFADFVRGPRAVLRYVAELMRGGHVRRPGHNPLGGWGVVLMLASVALQSVSGLFSSDDISEEGPLVARVSAAFVTSMTHIHHWNRYVLLALITLHAGAVALHWVLQRENLVAPMLHGTARFEARSAPWFVANLRALALFVFVAVVVWAIVVWGEAG